MASNWYVGVGVFLAGGWRGDSRQEQKQDGSMKHQSHNFEVTLLDEFNSLSPACSLINEFLLSRGYL